MPVVDEEFLPFLISVLLPLSLFAKRVGLLSTPVLRAAIALFVAVLVWLRAPWDGVDSIFLKRIDLLLAAALVALLVLRAVGRANVLSRLRYRAALCVIALAAVTTWTNFFSFHGGHWPHLHDVAHYYFGSRYSAEVGYGDLYVALLRAELEQHGHFRTPEARDLSFNALVPVENLIARSDEVKDRFTPERWEDFRADVTSFRDAMGQSWGEVVKDHGYNPPPTWSLIGGWIANRFPPGSSRGVFVLTLIDPLLLVAAFAAVGAVFGLETALLSIAYYCVTFGGEFAWKGGAFLREVSFAAIIACACLLGRDRPIAAGALLGLAAVLRVFPALLAAGIFLRAVFDLLATRTLRGAPFRFAAGFTVSAALLFAATLARPHAPDAWRGFAQNLSSHSQSASANMIGITSLFTYGRSFDYASEKGFTEAVEWRRTVTRLQLLTIFPLTLLFVALRSRQGDLLAALGLGTVLVFTGLNLSGYYYSVLALLVIVYRNEPLVLAGLFAVELGVYAIHLFEQHEVMLYLFKSLLLAWFFLGVHLTAAREQLARLAASIRSTTGATRA